MPLPSPILVLQPTVWVPEGDGLNLAHRFVFFFFNSIYFALSGPLEDLAPMVNFLRNPGSLFEYKYCVTPFFLREDPCSAARE